MLLLDITLLEFVNSDNGKTKSQVLVKVNVTDKVVMVHLPSGRGGGCRVLFWLCKSGLGPYEGGCHGCWWPVHGVAVLGY